MLHSKQPEMSDLQALQEKTANWECATKCM